MPTPLLVSRLGGRGAYRVEESPGSTETRCRLTAGGGDPRESATEKRPLRLTPQQGWKGAV